MRRACGAGSSKLPLIRRLNLDMSSESTRLGETRTRGSASPELEIEMLTTYFADNECRPCAAATLTETDPGVVECPTCGYQIATALEDIRAEALKASQDYAEAVLDALVSPSDGEIAARVGFSMAAHALRSRINRARTFEEFLEVPNVADVLDDAASMLDEDTQSAGRRLVDAVARLRAVALKTRPWAEGL